MFRVSIPVLAIVLLSAGPLSAKPVSQMSGNELIAWANARDACGAEKTVVQAVYDSIQNRVLVRCGVVGAQRAAQAGGTVGTRRATGMGPATGFFPLLGPGLLVAGLFTALAAGGGGHSTTSTATP